MFNSLRLDGGWISRGPRGHGNFRDDEIVSGALANVASEVRAFKPLIFQSNTNATAQSRSPLLASSVYFVFFFFTHQTQAQGVKMVVKIESGSQPERYFFSSSGQSPIHPLVRTFSL